MIILDTNIISEMMRPCPDCKVKTWIDQQPITDLFITSITLAEIYYGIRVLPEGKRQQALENAFNSTIKDSFSYRLLFFDESSANFYGKIMSYRKKIGRPMSILDGQIAAIAYSQNAILATRNINDFSDCNLKLADPFN